VLTAADGFVAGSDRAGVHCATGDRGGRPGPITVRVLGPVALHSGDEWVHTGGTKQRTVLAALMLARGSVVADSRLERLLWGNDPPDSARAQVQSYIYKLRRLVGPGLIVVRQGSGYALTGGRYELDLTEFERRAELARQALSAGRHEEAAQGLRTALALWRGPALADVTEHLKLVEQSRLEELRLAALEDRIDADLALVHESELVPELTGLVAEHPLRERLRGQLMLTLHRAGRRADALAAYQAAILGERAVPPAITPTAAPEPAPGNGTEPAHAERPAQLPPVGLDLVGRRTEVAAVLGRIPVGGGQGGRWVAPVCVVTGMAGVGKTSLATHVAQRQRDAYPDGQLFADLRGLDSRPADPAEILVRFLQALDADGTAVSTDMQDCLALYRSRLADRRILVVLDDAASAAQVRPLLPSGAGCAAIVTCRSRLSGLEGAGAVDLDVFGPAEAVELLARLAGAERVAAEPQAAASIGRLCGGLPLAVGIAGARLAARPHWPLSRLERRLDDEGRRVHELSHDDMDVRAAVLRGSQHLPNDGLRAWRLLARLEVPWFAAWVVAALLAIPVEIADELVDALVDARLLEVAAADRGRCAYYRFHGLVRAVAREQGAPGDTAAAGRAALGRAFAAWLSVAREAESRLTGLTPPVSGNGRSRRLPDEAVVGELLADPAGWLRTERPVLRAVVAQTQAESRRVLSSELAQVLGRLERAARPVIA
jgi:DNA-binding SARP family transcriptional activator